MIGGRAVGSPGNGVPAKTAGAGLHANARPLAFAATGDLAAGLLVGVSLLGQARWAATPEMTPCSTRTPAGRAGPRAHGLELIKEPFRLVGQKILVRPTRTAPPSWRSCNSRTSRPPTPAAGFSPGEGINPWISQAEHERRWTVALKQELEQVLRQFRGVKSASVPPLNQERRALRVQQEAAATASITLVMAGGEPVGRDLALAAARLVCGAVRGLLCGISRCSMATASCRL